jgi:hypothetical protein
MEHRQATQDLIDMKTWFNELLQNAAFPAVVLAFACAPINFKASDSPSSRLIDNHEELGSLASPDQLDGQVNQGDQTQSHLPTGQG